MSIPVNLNVAKPMASWPQVEFTPEEPYNFFNMEQVERGYPLHALGYRKILAAKQSKMENKVILVIVGGVVGVGVLLILILVPMSFVGLEYYEMGFRRSKSTGSVNVDHVYEFGKHFIGPDGDFKVFPASAIFETYTGITVFSADRWAALPEKVPNVRLAAPILLLVYHQLFRLFLEK